MPIKIVVIGSKTKDGDSRVEEQAREFGRLCALHGLTVVTGGGKGLPLLVAEACMAAGGKTIAISPATNKQEHVEKGWPTEEFTEIKFLSWTRFDEYTWEVRLKLRNALLMNEADVVALFAGGWGTLTEFGLNQTLKKDVFVLDGAGGFSGTISRLEGVLGKQAQVEYCTNAETMVLAMRSMHAASHGRI